MPDYAYEALPGAGTSSIRKTRFSRPNGNFVVRLLMALAAFLMMLYAVMDYRMRWTRSDALANTEQPVACLPSPTEDAVSVEHTPQNQSSQETVKGFRASDYLVGSPMGHFRDNLREEHKYLTAFFGAGWTNDVMSIANMIYLAMITQRIPIIPPFTASNEHIFGDAGLIQFSDVFDLARFQKDIGIPVIQWSDVKEGKSREQLGCWSTFMTVKANPEGRPQWTALLDPLGLDVSYTAVPSSTDLPDDDRTTSLWGLAQLTFPQNRQRTLDANPKLWPSDVDHHQLPPDEHLSCFDNVYFTGVRQGFEWETDYSPVWRFVGIHMRFTEKIVKLAEDYVRRSMGISPGQKLPPLITMHVRHGDFKRMCNDRPLDKCFRPVSAWAKDVAEVQQKLLETKGIDVKEVIVTSDEKDPKWWDEIRQQGWHFADHNVENTDGRFGLWYATLVDACIQSLGVGFAGTYGSTMSLVSLRRVQEWNGGYGVMTKWGGWGMETDF